MGVDAILKTCIYVTVLVTFSNALLHPISQSHSSKALTNSIGIGVTSSSAILLPSFQRHLYVNSNLFWSQNFMQRNCAHVLQSNSNDSDGDKIIALELLIISLAEEPTDDQRREKLKLIYSEKMSKSKLEAQEFATLFDTTLIRMGEEIQQRARQKAEELNRQQKSVEKVSEGGDDSSQESEKEKKEIASSSKEEKKLWAFIDMMVQSKSLAKKALG